MDVRMLPASQPSQPRQQGIYYSNYKIKSKIYHHLPPTPSPLAAARSYLQHRLTMWQNLIAGDKARAKEREREIPIEGTEGSLACDGKSLAEIINKAQLVYK